MRVAAEEQAAYAGFNLDAAKSWPLHEAQDKNGSPGQNGRSTLPCPISTTEKYREGKISSTVMMK